MDIRPFAAADLPDIPRIWNSSAETGEVLYDPLTEAYFRRKIIENEAAGPETCWPRRKTDILPASCTAPRR